MDFIKWSSELLIITIFLISNYLLPKHICICFHVIIWETNHLRYFKIPIEILEEKPYFYFTSSDYKSLNFPSDIKSYIAEQLPINCVHISSELVGWQQSDGSWTQYIYLHSSAIGKHRCMYMCHAEIHWISSQNLFAPYYESVFCYHHFVFLPLLFPEMAFWSHSVTIYVMLRSAYHTLQYKFLL